MKVYLLAAGYATRLYPLTRDTPKPLLDVAGQPILTRILRRVEALQGVSEVVVIGNDRFAVQFERWASETQSRVPLRVLNDGSRSEDDRLGAVGDLGFALREVPTGGEDWLVVAGDNLIEFDLDALHRTFLAKRRPLLVLRAVEHGPGPTRYNEVTLGGDGDVERFREKPPDPQGALAAIAVYFFTPEVADLLARYLEAGGERDAPGHFVEWLVQQTPVAAARLDGEWLDIGTPETLEHARRRLGR
ncbi:MAG: nucleotidyltransferase family protein [Deltaproteobacteria bacterium]|nr:nucleotidyltransferase family protein [Deltaproteobacteria bacterium]MBW2413316.1 nucleotidyltransferase family protein [Deltaproteobacteria bacterium]